METTHGIDMSPQAHRVAAELPELHGQVPHSREVLARDPTQEGPDLLGVQRPAVHNMQRSTLH